MKNFILFVFCFFNYTVYAQSGSLDSTFGINGKVTTIIDSSYSAANSVVIQSDGKIVAAGASGNNSNNDFALARYNSDGTLDSTFGFGGKVTTDFGSGSDIIYSIVIQSDGKIVAAGNTYNSSYVYDFAIARYNSNGTLDNTFGSGGKLVTDFGGGNDFGYTVLIQSDGKIVVVGSSYGTNSVWFMAVARYNSNGSFDNTFGTGGKTTTASLYIESGGTAMIQNDGKIIVTGWGWSIVNINTSRDFALVRYNNNGSLDNTFGTGGIIATDFTGNSETANSVAIQSDGKITVAGWSITGNNDKFALVRYNTNGSLDNTFGSSGKVTTVVGNVSEANSVTIQSDGKILVTGFSDNGSDYDFALVRYNSNGSLDSTFDLDGKVTTDFGGSKDLGNSVVIQNDGKIVVVGNSNTGSNYYFAIARYDNDYCYPVIHNQSPTIGNGQSIIVGSNIYSANGIYKDTLISVNGCDSIVTTNLSVLTGISENTSLKEIIIYPNPTTGKIVINSNNINSIELYNYLGEKVYTTSNFKQQTSNEIDLSNSPKGIYFVKMYDGEKFYTEKIIVQ